MAFTTPKVDFSAGDGFANTEINKTNENIRMLAGGDNTLPLSTDAATGKALAKRDADGDIAFRDIAARDVAASGAITASGGLYPSGILAGDYAIPGCFDDTQHDTNSTTYVKMAEIKSPVSGVIRILFTLDGTVYNTAYGRIYKNGIASGTERTTGYSEVVFSEDIAVSYGDLIQIYGKTSNAAYPTAIKTFALRYNGPGVYSLTLP
jgi:hypothetical protein